MALLLGLHDREAAHAVPIGGWILDTVALSENPPYTDYGGLAAGVNWITRLNWGYGSTGTLPFDDYANFAQRVAAYVGNSHGCSRWIIGNEPNLSREWPNNQPIYPWHYAECYKRCYRAIHGLPNHGGDEVLIAASGPWNAELKYPGNPNGDWIKYFEDVIKLCNSDVDGEAELDGFAIHSYTHGYNVNLVTSSARMQAPFQSHHYEFRAYQDYLEAIPDELRHLPVYMTEANGNGPWQAVGLIPAMCNELDNHNKSGGQPVKCIIFFRYPDKGDGYQMAHKGDVMAEFNAAVAAGYQSPPSQGATNVSQTTHIPTVSTGTKPQEPDLPPRQIDPRAIERGVAIEPAALALPGHDFWRVVKVQWYNEQEADAIGPDHHILADALDEQGKRKVGITMMVQWPTDAHAITTEAKPGEPYSANYPMSPSRNEFSIHVISGLGIPSEKVTGIGMGAETPGGFNAGIHTSTGVVFQLATMPAATQSAPSTGAQPAPSPAPSTPQEPPMQPGIIDPRVAQAILAIESGGRTHGENGKPLIRFEAHIFQGKAGNTGHFRYNEQKPWTDQQWRKSAGDPWRNIHTGKQADEYAAFEFAKSINPKAAYESISMGAPQIMGFNHARVGFPSAEAMFNAFQSAQVQTIAFINYFLSDPALVQAMQRKDWREIAKRYNGSGAVDTYAPLLEKAYNGVSA